MFPYLLAMPNIYKHAYLVLYEYLDLFIQLVYNTTKICTLYPIILLLIENTSLPKSNIHSIQFANGDFIYYMPLLLLTLYILFIHLQ